MIPIGLEKKTSFVLWVVTSAAAGRDAAYGSERGRFSAPKVVMEGVRPQCRQTSWVSLMSVLMFSIVPLRLVMVY